MKNGFKAAAIGALALTMAWGEEQKSRYVKADVSYNFPPGRRTLTVDCETLAVVQTSSGKKLSPKIAYAAGFDLLPDPVTLEKYNNANAQEKEKILGTINAEEKQILISIANLPPEIQKSFYVARNDMRMLTNEDAKNFYDYLVTHAVGAHGVKRDEFKPAAAKCEPYHEIR